MPSFSTRSLARLLLVGGVISCGSGTPVPDAGSGPPDAGEACDPVAQTGCASGQRCTLTQSESGNTVTTFPTCVTAGTTAAYAACASDAACSAGTICTDIVQTTGGVQSGQACYPFCDISTDRSQPCSLGGTCIGQIQGTTFGLCDRQAPDGGAPTDGG